MKTKNILTRVSKLEKHIDQLEHIIAKETQQRRALWDAQQKLNRRTIETLLV